MFGLLGLARSSIAKAAYLFRMSTGHVLVWAGRRTWYDDSAPQFEHRHGTGLVTVTGPSDGCGDRRWHWVAGLYHSGADIDDVWPHSPWLEGMADDRLEAAAAGEAAIDFMAALPYPMSLSGVCLG